EAAFRAAVGLLFSLGLGGMEADLGRLLAGGGKETKESIDARQIVERIVLEAPQSRAVEGLLWQLAALGMPEQRIPFLTKLGTLEFDDKVLAKWLKLAQDREEIIRDKALAVL